LELRLEFVMNASSPCSKPTLLIVVSAFLLFLASTDLPDAFGQKRGKAPQKSASRAAGLVEEGEKLLEERKWSEAVEVYKLAVRLDPNYAPAHGGLGDAYFGSGSWEPGLAAYKEQARLAPNNAEAQYALGYAYNTMGRHGEAFAPLVRATSLDPTFAEAFYGIGYAYLRGADVEKSVGFFKSALRLQPDYADAYYGLGLAYSRMGETAFANDQIKKLATIDVKLSRKLEKEIATPPTASHATRVKERIKATGVSQVLVLLDACRNDPGCRADAPPGNKTFNLFPSTSTLQKAQQGNMVMNVAACNDDGIIPSTIIKLIYRLSAQKR
jgi:tetratricopeptide (TPR) repeat protein